MGVRLMVEILDHWSDFGLTAGERNDLLVIAENANDKTRETYGSIHAPYILHRAGNKTPASWKNSISKLMKKKVLEHAVKNGREMTGVWGKTAQYRIPHLCPLKNHDGLWGQCERPAQGHLSGDPTGGEAPTQGHLSGDPQGHLSGDPRVTSQMTQSPHSPHYSPHPLRTDGLEPQRPASPRATEKKTTKKTKTEADFNPVDFVMETTGVTETEAAAILARLQATNTIKTLSGFLRHIAANGDLQAAADTHRATRSPRRTELCDEHTRPINRCPFCAVQKEAS